MVVNENGVCLNQKRVPRLCLIRPEVHLPSNQLLLQASGQTESVSLYQKKCINFKKKFKYMNLVLKDLSFFLGAGMNVISVPLESKAETHTSYQVCQSKVCGDR